MDRFPTHASLPRARLFHHSFVNRIIILIFEEGMSHIFRSWLCTHKFTSRHSSVCLCVFYPSLADEGGFLRVVCPRHFDPWVSSESHTRLPMQDAFNRKYVSWLSRAAAIHGPSKISKWKCTPTPMSGSFHLPVSCNNQPRVINTFLKKKPGFLATSCLKA